MNAWRTRIKWEDEVNGHETGTLCGLRFTILALSTGQSRGGYAYWSVTKPSGEVLRERTAMTAGGARKARTLAIGAIRDTIGSLLGHRPPWKDQD